METTDHLLIRTELERILSSKTFKQSYILSNFLRYVVIETIEDHCNEIKEYSIAVKALGKPDDFNPQLDAVVRIHAGRLRRCLHLYYSEEGINNPMTISLPKGTYIPQFILRDNLEIAPLLLQLEEFTVGNLVIHKVAVLPFSNLSVQPEAHFVVERFCEQLSSDLAAFREISMVSYFSTSKYRVHDVDVRQVGKELNASFLVTGSIYHDKKRLRVSVQLVSTESGLQLWTKTFERELTGTYIYDVIDGIVKQVTCKLAGYTGIILKNIAALLNSDAVKERDVLDPLSFYYYYLLHYTEDAFQLTRQQLEKTIKKNPESALAWAILAQLYTDGCILGYISVQNPLHEALRCAQKSLQLDPECQHGYMSLAWALLHLQDDQGALESINYGLSLDSGSAFYLGFASLMFALVGNYDLCMEYFEKSKELNGGCPWWIHVGPILMHFYQGNYAAALQCASHINIPGVFWNQFFKVAALGHVGQPEEAVRSGRQFQAEFPGHADIGCVVLKRILTHEVIYDRIRAGLMKSGIKIYDIHLLNHKAS
jgi:adenylate cyclase